jgi:glycine/D-amino acid oxidase-like deaminating enzyme
MRLHSGAPFWLVKNGLEEMDGAASLPRDIGGGEFDVAIVGAGITGALVAAALTAERLSVVILDRRAPASGSTAASTALVSYEIDVDLTELIEKIGEPDAVRAYQLSAESVESLGRIAASLDEPTGFEKRPSLYLASHRRHTRRVQREVEARQRAGLDAEFWSRERVEQTYGFSSHGALRTTVAGTIDPVRFTRALLRRAVAGGASLLSRTRVQAVERSSSGTRLITERGELRARWVVYAMGYETPEPLRPEMVALHSTYALATEPIDDLGPWRDQCLVWETARPYYYMRTTEDCRILVGGADAPFKNVTWRDRLMPDRTRRLEKRLRTLLPSVATETAFAWAGTFAETKDGLPFIGPSASCPQALFALGYGGNGITFGAIAADILRDLCLGRPNDDARVFRLDR